MNPCTCGDAAYEHTWRSGHFAECEVEGCDCVYYEDGGGEERE